MFFPDDGRGDLSLAMTPWWEEFGVRVSAFQWGEVLQWEFALHEGVPPSQ